MLSVMEPSLLTKQTAPEELVEAVMQVLTGHRSITTSIGEHLASSLSKNLIGPDRRTLSERESEVLILLAQRDSIKHIAQSLALNTKTVNTCRGRLLDKLQLTTTAELIRYPLEHHRIENGRNDDSSAPGGSPLTERRRSN